MYHQAVRSVIIYLRVPNTRNTAIAVFQSRPHRPAACSPGRRSQAWVTLASYSSTCTCCIVYPCLPRCTASVV